MDLLDLPERTKNDRTFGLTSIIDFGISLGELEAILDDYYELIDFAKIGVGSAYITPKIKEKVQLYKSYGIKPYCGGTLFEKFYFQKKVSNYLLFIEKLGIEWLEISTGVINIPLKERVKLISDFKQKFNIIGEVGSKDSAKEMSTSDWLEEMITMLNAGCQYVIAEGRNSGTSGIYHRDGKIKKDLVTEVMKELDYKKIIFEAPTAEHQLFFINEFGTNVNLGNVNIQDVLLLEAQRCGLRSETFFLEERKWKLLL